MKSSQSNFNLRSPSSYLVRRYLNTTVCSKSSIFLTTYQPLNANVICEGSLTYLFPMSSIRFIMDFTFHIYFPAHSGTYEHDSEEEAVLLFANPAFSPVMKSVRAVIVSSHEFPLILFKLYVVVVSLSNSYVKHLNC